ncbi:MAG: cyclic nucleotide-binding domain-containing protein [Lachnospiraceae bacterium]|nr:cyclic nucleotide-binding domain-containing protein [Lachnospiraceae bacterium]
MDILNSKINAVLEATDKIPDKEKQYINQLFQNAPLWIFDHISVQKYKKNETFISEDDPVCKVFILLSGDVKAIDHRIFGIEYDYMRFHPIKLFGSMEILLEIKNYKTTLCTMSDCTFLVMNATRFKEWIENDIHAMKMEIKSIGSYLLDQGRRERTFLFLNGIDRLYMVFINNYEQLLLENKKCVLSYTRQELSDCSGLSIKTINRAIKKILAIFAILLVGTGIAFNSCAMLGNDSVGIVYDGVRNIAHLTPSQLGFASNIVNYSLIILLLFIGRKYVNIGLDPFTGIVMVLVDKFKLEYRIVKILFDLIMIALGILLGGHLGIITIITALVAGPIIQFFTACLKNLLL